MNEENEIMEQDEIDLPQSFIVLMIPDDTVEVDITAKIYQEHRLREVTRHMDFDEVRAAIRDAEQNYIPSDTLFTIAPTPEERVRELLERYLEGDRP